MKKTIYEIDEEGFMTYNTLEVNINEPYPSNYVDVPLPSDKMGNQRPFWKPQWTGTGWIETRPQSEIEEEMNKPTPPNPIAVIGKRIVALEGELMVTEVINKAMGSQLIAREFEIFKLQSDKVASDKKISDLQSVNDKMGQQIVQMDIRLMKGGIV